MGDVWPNILLDNRGQFVGCWICWWSCQTPRYHHLPTRKTPCNCQSLMYVLSFSILLSLFSLFLDVFFFHLCLFTCFLYFFRFLFSCFMFCLVFFFLLLFLFIPFLSPFLFLSFIFAQFWYIPYIPSGGSKPQHLCSRVCRQLKESVFFCVGHDS